MKNELLKKMEDAIAAETGFLVSISQQDGQYIAELEFSSDANEDVIINIWYANSWQDFVNSFKEYASSFDADEHAASYIAMRGKRGVPDSIKTLINDADSIKDTLEAVSLVLDKRAYDDLWNEREDRKPREEPVYKMQSEDSILTTLRFVQSAAQTAWRRRSGCESCPFFASAGADPTRRKCRFNSENGICAPTKWSI